MGTRHLITIVKDGEFKLAQYGQWDGYPSGQGADILKFLTEGDVEALRRNIDKLYFVTDEEVDAFFQTVGIPAGQQRMTMDQSNTVKEVFPSLHRDTGAGILDLIASGKVNKIDDLTEGEARIPTTNRIAFAGGWACEWAYTIDLDKGTFEVYEAGLSDEGEPNRFTDVIKKEYEGEEETPRFVRLVGEYELHSLPTWEQFLEELQPEALERHREWLARMAAEEAKADNDGDTSADPEEGNDGDRPIWSM